MQSPSKKIIINGRFLTQGLTGVQRVASEIVLALDSLLVSKQLPDALQHAQWLILTPKNVQHHLALKAITIEETGSLKGHAWEQIDLFWAARNHTLLNFCNSGSVLHPRQFVLIHDACVYRHPEFYGNAYRMLHQSLGKLLAKNSAIGTVSHFSAREIADILKLPESAVGVFYNGVNHMHRLKPDAAIVEKLGLQQTPYFLCIGSLTKNKNVQLAVDALSQIDNRDIRLVVVGGGNQKIFGSEQRNNAQNVIFTGRLTDAEIASLLLNTKAFVFPSIYEGFGLPPLEAMALGCPVLASNAPAVMEVCTSHATYFDPTNAKQLAALMQTCLDNPAAHSGKIEENKLHAETFAWEKSARGIANFIIEKHVTG